MQSRREVAREGSDFDEHSTREFSKGKYNNLGEYIFSSGIACLPTGLNARNEAKYYTLRPKDEGKDLSITTKMVYRKNFQGDSTMLKHNLVDDERSPYRVLNRCQSANGYISVQNKRKPILTGIIHLPFEANKGH